MLKRLARQTTAVFLVAVFLGGSLAAANAIVLCIGEDGHVALEAAHGGVCTAHASSPQRRAVANRGEPRKWSCGSCIDIPLWGSLLSHGPFPVPTQAAGNVPLVPAATWVDHGPVLCSCPGGTTESPFAQLSHLAVIRTAVLII